LGNPGPTGWAWYIDENRWRSGGFAHGTNNIGELTAVLDLLQQTAADGSALHIICDSTYVINTITKWMAGWKRKGWRKGDGKPVQNLEIIQALDEAMTGRDVTFEWVKGHTGHPLNEAADSRANAAAQAFKDGHQVETGPGFSATGQEPDLFSMLAHEDVLVRSDEDVVLEQERRLFAPTQRPDVSEMAGLLHSDWHEIGRSGRLWTRDEVLTWEPVDSENVDIEMVSASRMRPDLILLVTRRVSRENSIWSSWWQREPDGRWLALFHQGTPER
jgi:ribonuclease HI